MRIMFYLYRLKIERSRQSSLFEDAAKSPSDIIREAIEEKPSKEIRKGNIWHIGNVERVDDTGLFFAFGRVTKSIVEKFDEEAGNFRDEPEEQAPYTHVLLDLEYQVCAIAHKSKIAPKVSQIASNLARLLNETEIVKSRDLKLVMAEISDPNEFLKYVRNAYAIRKFEVGFSPPNPWDAEEDFQKPMEKFAEVTGGTKGKTIIQGEALEKEPIEKLASAAAATGNSASAQLQEKRGGNFVTKRIGGNPTTLASDEIATKDEKNTMLSKLKALYKTVRNAGDQ